MKPLGVIDNGFLQMETETTPMHVAVLGLFDFPADFDGDRNAFFTGVINFLAGMTRALPPFNQQLVFPLQLLGWPAWQHSPSYDAHRQIRVETLPSPGTRTQLDDLVCELHAQRLDRDRPLWEIVLIDGLDDGQFAMYIKMHHSTVDGVGGSRLMHRFFSRHPEPPSVPGVDDGSDVAAEAATDWGAETTIWSQLKDHFSHIASQYIDKIVEPKMPAPFTAPETRINGKVNRERSFAVAKFSLQEFKQIRKATGATSNDLVLAVCAGALREYLDMKNSLPDDSLVGFMPMSVRSKSGGQTGNDLSFMLINLATKFSDPLERLGAISESTRDAKDQLGHMSHDTVLRHASLFSWIARFGHITGLTDVIPAPFNVVVSNVPGAPWPLYLNGARMNSIHPVSMLYQKQALNFTVTSYDGSLEFGMLACRASVPDLTELVASLYSSFAELSQAAFPGSGRSMAV